jgi:hypothetical protein
MDASRVYGLNCESFRRCLEWRWSRGVENRVLGVAGCKGFLLAVILLLLWMFWPAIAEAQKSITPAPPSAEVYFVGIKNNATVSSKLKLNFGLKGVGVAPAGSDLPNTGHHHILVDTPLPPLNKPIPNDFKHLHFGGGQTAATIELSPGWHTLQLLLGDKDHIPHSPPVMSPVLRVKVVPQGGPTPSPESASVYFVELKDGQVVPTKFKVRFGLKGMGVAPANSERPNSGHHHLLVDTELPNLTSPIPSDFNHLHFGAGQTEVTVELSPGRHTLQLLLGDKDHIPHSPPLFSKKITVIVAESRKRLPSPPNAEVYFIGLKDGAVVNRKFTLYFGLSGMGVAPAGIGQVNTGHHHLLIDTKLPPLDRAIPSDFRHLHFGSGQTEATLTLSPGKHTLQLLLGDSEHVPHDPPVTSKPVTIIVK